MIKTKFLHAFTIVLILLQAFMPIPALAMAGSDLADYLPGSVVTISGDNSSGAGYLPLETVHVHVSGPGDIALACDATADESGAWSCQVTLPSDDSAAGYYEFIAAGQTSGVSESGAFTVTAPPPPAVEPSPEPTQEPTVEPTSEPTQEPTAEPTAEPTLEPTAEPTQEPTAEPTVEPAETPAPAPFIQSDKDDYAPGEVVTLASSNWQPGEWVVVFVNDNIGQTWSMTTNRQADENGAFIYEFNLPSWFVATYQVIATGEFSGMATTSFTDANLQNVSLQVPTSVTVAPGGTANYTVNVNFNGSSGNCTVTLSVPSGLPAGANVTFSGTNPTTTNANYSRGLIITTDASTPPGSYTFTVQAARGNNCQGSGDLTVNGTLVVVKRVGTVTVGAQTGTLTFGTPGSASFLITVNRNGATGAGTGFTVSLGLSGTLPSGATAVMSPPSLTFSTSDTSKTSTLTITTIASTPAGSTPFTVTAVNQTLPSDNSSGPGTLLVSKANQTITFGALADKTYGDADFNVSATASSGLAVSFGSQTTSVCTVSGSTVHIAAAGTCTLRASQAGNSNYNAAADVDQSFTVAQRAVTVTADAQSKTYGDPDPALTYQVTGGSLVGSDSFSGALARAAGENVGAYAINQGTLTLGANYNLSFVGANLTIDPRAVEVTAEDNSKTYGDADPALTYVISEGSLAFSDVFGGTLVREAGEDVGEYDINQGTLALNGNYNLTFVSGVFTIGTRAVTVKADPQTKVYGDADPVLTYQITAGSLASGDAFSGALSRAPGQNVGLYAINQGTLSLNSNYVLSYVGANLEITPRPITVKADPQTKVYGEADPALTYEITSGTLAFSDVISGGLARDAGENVGTYAINQGSLTAGTNYALTFVSDDLTITPRPVEVTADGRTKVYGQADPALTYQITSGSLAFSDTFSGSLSRTEGEDVGSYTISQGSLSLGGNYALSFVGANLTITKATLTVDADDQSKTYGQADPSFTFQTTGFQFDDDLGDIDAAPVCSVSGAHDNAGTYTIDCSGGADANYNFEYEEGTLTVGQAVLTVTADNKFKTYGQADPTFTFQYSGFQFFDDAGDLDTAPSCNVAGAHVNAGSYTIECSGGSDANYSFAYFDGTLTVDPASLTITADDKVKIYGSANPPLTASYSGFVNGDDAGDLDTPVSLSTLADETSPVGDYVITASGAADANYTITHVNGTLTVNAKALTIKANNQSKIYGSPFTFAGTEFTTDGLVNGNTVTSVTLTSAGAAAAASVGTYPIVPSAAVGTGLANYDITYENGTFTVNLKSLTITADDQSKTYGSLFTFDGDEFTTDGLVNGDTLTSVTLTSDGAAATAAVAGSPYAIVASDAVGSGLANYDIEYVDGEFTVEPKALTITANDQSKTYGEEFIFDGTEFTTDGLVNSDSVTSVTLTSDGASATAEVSGSPYAIEASAAQGSGLTNYSITYVDGEFTVDPRALTITADDQGKTYGESFNFTGAEFDAVGLVNDDTVDSVTLTSAGAAATAAVGPYAIVASDAVGSGLGNYTIFYVDGTLTVSSRPITVTADAKTKVYGQADPALTYQITGGSLANGDTFSGVLTRDPGENVDSYAITQGSLALSSNYTLTFIGANLTITQATLTVTADPQSRIYGEPNPPLTFAYSGFQFLDDASDLDIEPSCSTWAAQFSNVGDYPIICSGGDDNNYAFSYVGNTLTITQRPATVTADNKSKIYGDDNPNLTATVTNTVNGDVLDYSLATTAEQFSDVGPYPITVTVGSNPNYDVTSADGTLTIEQKSASVTANDKSKTYGDANPEWTATVVNEVAGGDAIQYTLSSTAGQFSGVGDYPITVTLGDNPNYNVTPTNGTLTINKKAASVTADAKVKTYGDPNPLLTATVVNEVLGGDAIQYTLSTTATQFSDVGPYSITVTLGDNPNYELTKTDGTLTIEKKAASVTADAKSKVYGDLNPALTATVVGEVAGGDAIEYTISTTAGQFSDVGPYPITVTLGSNPNYEMTKTDGTLTIEQKSASVSADAKSKVYGDLNPALTATVVGEVAGGDAIEYTLSTDAEQFSDVGEYVITVTLGSNPNYDITPVNGTLTIEKRVASVTAHAKTKTYGDINPALTATVVNEVAGGDAIEYTLATTAGQFSGVGGYPITVTLGDNPNYEVTKTDATLTITQKAATVAANNKSKTYGDDNPAFDAIVTGTVNGDVLNYTLTTPAGKFSDVGGYPIEVTLGSNPNYNITPVNGTLTINPAVLTVTAYSQSKIYGELNPALTFAYSGFLGSDNPSMLETEPFCSTLAVQFSNVGGYDITCSGGVDNNYTFSYVGNTLTITQRPATVTADAKSKTYGDDNPGLTATVDNTVNGDVLNYSLATTAEKYSDVGSYAITVNLGSNPNYAVTPVNGILSITPATLTVTANPRTKVYGQPNPFLTFVYSGFLGTDDSSVLDTAPACSTSAGQYSDVGDYPITCSGGVDNNYAFSYAGNTLTITPATLTVTANPQTKVYGQPNPSLTFVYSGFLGTDGPSVLDTAPSCSTTADQYSDVGGYDITCAGGEDNNYAFSYTGNTLTITKATLLVTANPQSKTYGEVNPALTFAYGSFQGTDTASVLETAPICFTTAGQYSDVGEYDITCSGGVDNNYAFDYVADTLTINKRAASVTANAQSKTYGDDNPALTATVVGQVPGGSIIEYSLATTALKLSNVGDYPITVTLGDNPNYELTPTDSILTINKKAASVNADNKSKTYSDDNPVLTATVAGQVPGGDVLSYSLATTAVKLSNAGNYPITVTLGANPNYEVAKADGTLTVNKALLTVTADNKSKYFAGPDPAFTFQYSGFVNSETASVIDTPPTCTVAVPHAAVGTYPITCSGGLDNNYDFDYVNGTLTVDAWTLRGFYSPVDMGGVYNLVKNGSTVPLKFEIFSGGTEITDVSQVKSLTYVIAACTSAFGTDEIETLATGGTALRYDTTSGQFIYNWKTPSGTAGKCFRVTLTTMDNSTVVAYFKMK